ncbi:hypothetical protein EMIHUDRAFT_196804, partial [Emiliania huxleyi CCMP1516]|uniref:Right handed beta helix domain-containing protein n=2 Tax=Emiliania huxleyi TaxID=2903 RepID=A0A0D3J4R0_EMIH1
MTDIYLQPGANVRLSQSLVLDGINVTIRSSGSITGATIDGTDALDSLFILRNEATLQLEGLVLANCRAEADGGAVRMENSDASLRDVRIQDCYAGNSGGAIYAAKGSLRLESVEITRCSTGIGTEGENAKGLGGAIRIVKVPEVELSEVNITGCSAVKGGALHIDGGTDSETTLNRVRLADSTATEEGGLIYISTGRLALENGTLLESGTASQGSSIAFGGSPEVSYRLPLPPGYWIPHSRCEIYRQLPADCDAVCRALFDKCKTETDAQNNECKQFPVAFVQPCNWEATPALLGVSLYQVPTSALDVDLPYACAPGILGSSDAEDQSTVPDPCNDGTTTYGQGSTACDVCDEDFFLVLGEAQASTKACKSCPAVVPYTCGVDTRIGALYVPGRGSLNVSSGWWRASNESSTLFACKDGNALCHPFYEGPKCEVCTNTTDNGIRYFLNSKARCQPCDRPAESVMLLVGLLCAAGALGLGTLKVIRSSWAPSGKVARALVLLGRRIALLWKRAGMLCKTKQLINLFQVVAVVPAVYELDEVPPQLSEWAMNLFNAVNIFDLDLFLPPACYGSYLKRLIAWGFLPFAPILLATLGSCAWELVAQARHSAAASSANSTRAALWRGFLRVLPLILILQFLLVTSTSTHILRTFNCIEFPTRDAVLPGMQEPYRAYLADDLSLDCSTPEYATAQRWAYVLLFVWPIGAPLLYLGLLLASRRDIMTR